MTKTRIAKVALATGLLALLGGCQSFPMTGQQFTSLEAGKVDASSYFAQRLADGRRHLQANRPAAAITAFRQASYDPELRAEAYNGMAIAYDRLGRADLAEELFIAAVRLSPSNDRYSANLALFGERQMRQIEEALAQSPTDLSPDSLGEQAAAPPLEALPAERLRRVSDREIELVVPSTTENAGAQLANARVPSITVGRQADEARGDRDYPVRVALDPGRVAAAGETATGRSNADNRRTGVRWAWTPGPRRNHAYPVRIPLSSSDS